ncbi:hypothetical protein QQS21_008761 [Conoideocrella luteorostrata]|uniref:Uncharacterized protein n=1 Tax=Conoideocrella luteorostrata TaxID=1105319 RepID=A0AAJ0CKL6_9HYPO|nr:hypothetical protein QQS21_008761 [Conoideocrella luteorostrata]
MNGEKYGTLVEYNEAALMQREIARFPQAALILEAQKLLLHRLCIIVDAILNGVNSSKARGCERWEMRASEGFKHVGRAELWSSLANQPFSTPPRLNMSFIVSVASVRRQAIEDHLSELQLHPAYFRQHTNSIVECFMGESDSEIIRTAQCCVHWRNEVAAYRTWLMIEEKCLEVQSLILGTDTDVLDGNHSTKIWEEALAGLATVLQGCVTTYSRQLRTETSLCSNFDGYFEKKEQKASEFEPYRYRLPRWPMEKIYWADTLVCYLIHLGQITLGEGWQHFTPPNLFAAMDHLVLNNPKELRRIPSLTMSGSLSNLAAAVEIQFNIRQYAFKKRTYDYDTVRKVVFPLLSEDVAANQYKYWVPPLLDSCLDLLKNFYDKPAPSGPKNKVRLQEARRQREVIETFWLSMRNYMQKQSRYIGFSEKVVSKIDDTLSMSSKPEYCCVIEKEEAGFMSALQACLTDHNLSHYVESGVNNLKSTLDVQGGSNKTKSRRDDSALTLRNQDKEPIAVEQEQPQIPQKIVVPKRALSIFHLMFPTSPGERCRTIHWDEFVHAMNDAGFVAQSLGGSAVGFEQVGTADTDSKSISFHRPHPVPKIDPIMLRSSIARRLANRFGWHRDHFILAGNDNQTGAKKATE